MCHFGGIVRAASGRPNSEPARSPKARNIAAYCRRVLGLAARAAIRLGERIGFIERGRDRATGAGENRRTATR